MGRRCGTQGADVWACWLIPVVARVRDTERRRRLPRRAARTQLVPPFTPDADHVGDMSNFVLDQRLPDDKDGTLTIEGLQYSDILGQLADERKKRAVSSDDIETGPAGGSAAAAALMARRGTRTNLGGGGGGAGDTPDAAAAARRGTRTNITQPGVATGATPTPSEPGARRGTRIK